MKSYHSIFFSFFAFHFGLVFFFSIFVFRFSSSISYFSPASFFSLFKSFSLVSPDFFRLKLPSVIFFNSFIYLQSIPPNSTIFNSSTQAIRYLLLPKENYIKDNIFIRMSLKKLQKIVKKTNRKKSRISTYCNNKKERNYLIDI